MEGNKKICFTKRLATLLEGARLAFDVSKVLKISKIN